jgi:hypothetical protein
MEVLDEDSPDGESIFDAVGCKEGQADYSSLILRALVPRLILLFMLSAVLLFLLLFVYTPSSLIQLGNDLIFVYRKSVLFMIIFGAILMLLISFSLIYVNLLRDSVQMIQDYRSQKILIYESRIVEKLYDPHSDTPYHVLLRHTIDRRQKFSMQKNDFDHCQVGGKVFVSLSYHAKILLSLQG